MSEKPSDKPHKPVEDLKEGLGLLFRAAKGAVESLPTDKIEGVAKDAAKEVGRAFESLGSEIEKVITGKPGQPAAPGTPPAEANAANPANAAQPPAAAPAPEPPKDDVKYDNGYAPEPPKGPRVG